jgi:uncharacterized membrane protein
VGMKIGTTRVETFSDGVMSIIITIMVLSLKVPDINHKTTTYAVYGYLHQLLPYFLAYAFSFMMIGIFWTNHHHMFHLLDKTDERLIILNLIFLFWVSLVPLATVIIGSNPLLPISAVVYGGVMLLVTLSFALMRSYSLSKKLVHKDEDTKLTKKINYISIKARSKSFIGTLAYLVSLPLAYE